MQFAGVNKARAGFLSLKIFHVVVAKYPAEHDQLQLDDER